MSFGIVDIVHYQYKYVELRLEDSFKISFVALVIILHDPMMLTYRYSYHDVNLFFDLYY